MNILLLSPLYHPYVGGAETHTRLLAEGLVALRHDVSVITDRGYADQPRTQTHHGVRIARTTAFGFPDPRSRESVRWEVGLLDLLPDIKDCLDVLVGQITGSFDVVHAQGQGAFLFGAVVAGDLDVPLVVTSHETLPFDDKMGRSRSAVLHEFSAIDKVVAGSDFFVKQALASGVHPDKIALVPYGVESPEQAAAPVDLPAATSREPLRIASVGRFKPRKNQLALVDAVHRLRDEGMDVRCSLVGRYDASSRSYYEEVRTAIAENNLTDHVRIFSELDDRERARVLSDSHLAVQPARHEGFGLAALETVLAGRITVATPNEGHQETFGRTSPFLTDGFSGASLATKIRDVVTHSHKYTAELTRTRELFARRNSVQRSASGTAAVYQESVSRRKRTSPIHPHQ